MAAGKGGGASSCFAAVLLSLQVSCPHFRVQMAHWVCSPRSFLNPRPPPGEASAGRLTGPYSTLCSAGGPMRSNILVYSWKRGYRGVPFSAVPLKRGRLLWYCSLPAAMLAEESARIRTADRLREGLFYPCRHSGDVRVFRSISGCPSHPAYPGGGGAGCRLKAKVGRQAIAAAELAHDMRP